MINQKKEQNLILEFFLVSISGILFWYLTGLFDGSGFGTDMGRYYYNYQNLGGKGDFSSVLDLFAGSLKDPINYVIQYIFKILGFSFHAFLLLVIFSFYKGSTHRLNIIIGKRIRILQIITVLFFTLYLKISVYTAFRHSLALVVILFFCIQVIHTIFSKLYFLYQHPF